MEKKKLKRSEVLEVLDAWDKEVPPNPGQSVNEFRGDSEFEKIFNDSPQSQGFKIGDIVKGKITQIRNDFIIVDINYKSEGIIPKSEFRIFKNEKGEKSEVQIGQEIEVCIEQIENDNGTVVLSKDKADIKKAWEDIIKATDNNETIQGTVIAQIKGGLSVDIGVRAFLPGSQLDVRPVKNLKPYIGQTYDFKVIKVNQKRGNIVLSRKVILEKEREHLGKESGAIKEGSVVKGAVRTITDYGAFIELSDGSFGLLHITDLSWSRVEKVSSVIQEGQTIDVKVLKVDNKKNRISLGLKQLDDSKWEEAVSEYQVGSVVKGRVSNIVDYGAFVVLKNGLEGLVYINEISWNKRVKNISEFLKAGDEVDVKVIEIQKENHKMSLSIKQAQDNPWNKIMEKYSVGQDIERPIVSISDFGLFVKVDDSIDGLVRASDVSWLDTGKPLNQYKENQMVKVKILDINSEEEKFSLGIKQLTPNPWDFIEETYSIGSQHTFEVTRLVDYGAFVKIYEKEGDLLEGLIHISELSKKRINKPEDVVKVGDSIKVEVLNIDRDAKKVGLSARLAESDQPQGDKKEATQEGGGKFMENIFAKVLKKSLKEKEESDSDEGSKDS